MSPLESLRFFYEMAVSKDGAKHGAKRSLASLLLSRMRRHSHTAQSACKGRFFNISKALTRFARAFETPVFNISRGEIKFYCNSIQAAQAFETPVSTPPACCLTLLGSLASRVTVSFFSISPAAFQLLTSTSQRPRYKALPRAFMRRCRKLPSSRPGSR